MTPGFFAALAYPFKGLGLLARRRDLWKYAFWAFAVNLALFVGLAVAFLLLREDLVRALTPAKTPGWLTSILGCLLTVIAAGIGLFLYTIVGNIVAGPFLDAMAERILAGLGESLPPSRGFWNALGRSVRNQLVKLLFFGSVQALLLILLATPFSFLQPVPAAFFTVLFLGFEYLDYPLDARRLSIPDRFGWVFRHLGPALGYGAVILAVFPFLGYFLLPAFVTGAALLAHDVDGGA